MVSDTIQISDTPNLSSKKEEQQSVVEVPLLAAFLFEAPALGDWRPCVFLLSTLGSRNGKARIHVFDQARSGAAHNDLSTAAKPSSRSLSVRCGLGWFSDLEAAEKLGATSADCLVGCPREERVTGNGRFLGYPKF